jgi:argininosuccinate lyase
MAWDLSLYTSGEFRFVTLPDRFTTGSSIMPNKRNPDVVELLRATAGRAFGAMHRLESILSLPSGYHRDLQETKGPVLKALRRGLQALEIVPDLLADLEFDADRMAEAIDTEMYATDHAQQLAASGTPFREAYRQTKNDLEDLDDVDPESNLDERVSLGGPGNPGLDILRERLEALELNRDE